MNMEALWMGYVWESSEKLFKKNSTWPGATPEASDSGGLVRGPGISIF